jgi:hypothetical protein
MKTIPLLLILLLGVVRSDGAGISGPVKVASEAIQPHMAIGNNGSIYVVFIRRGNIDVAVSHDKGQTFSAPVTAIDAQGKAGGGCQRGPRIGVDANRIVYITDPLSKWPDIVLAVSSDGGKAFSKPRPVNDVPDQSGEALHWLAVSSAGELQVAWLDRRLRGERPGKDLACAKVTGEGTNVHANLVLPGPICECCAPGVAVDGRGNPSIVYREGQIQANRQIFLVTSTNGGTSFMPPARVNGVETGIGICPMDAPSVAVTRDGKKRVVAWMDMHADGKNRDVEWVFEQDGKFGQEMVVNDVLQGQQGHPSVVFDSDERAWCAWEDGRDGADRQSIYAINSKAKQNFRVSDSSEGKCSYPTLAVGGGVMGVVYEANRTTGDEVGSSNGSSIVFRRLY